MKTVIVLLYAVAMALSLAGIFVPLVQARRFHAKTKRATKVAHELMVATHAGGDSEADEARRTEARKHQRAELAKPFEGGPQTLEELSQGWIFRGGSVAQNALKEAQSRSVGIAWVASGVIVGSFASILSVLLPA